MSQLSGTIATSQGSENGKAIVWGNLPEVYHHLETRFKELNMTETGPKLLERIEETFSNWGDAEKTRLRLQVDFQATIATDDYIYSLTSHKPEEARKFVVKGFAKEDLLVSDATIQAVADLTLTMATKTCGNGYQPCKRGVPLPTFCHEQPLTAFKFDDDREPASGYMSHFAGVAEDVYKLTSHATVQRLWNLLEKLEKRPSRTFGYTHSTVYQVMKCCQDSAKLTSLGAQDRSAGIKTPWDAHSFVKNDSKAYLDLLKGTDPATHDLIETELPFILSDIAYSIADRS